MKLVPIGDPQPSAHHKWRWIILPVIGKSATHDAWMTTSEVNKYRGWFAGSWDFLHDGELVRVYTNGTITYCFVHVEVIE